MWLEAFQARPFIIDRVKHSEPIVIPRLSLGVAGGIQPDKLTSTLLAGDDDGMAARFLYCWPEPVLPKRPTPTPVDERPLSALRRLQNLRMGTDDGDSDKLIPITVRLSEGAADLLQKFRESNHTEAQTASGLYAGHVGKFPGLVVRLALVLEFLKWSVEGGAEPGDIGVEAVGYAAHLVDDYFKSMAIRAFGDAALPEADRHAATIAKHIVKEQCIAINASDIRRHWKLAGLREADKVSAALKILEEAHCVRKNPTRHGTTTGRQKSDYVVSPKLLAARL
jgi:hypothetical protein